MPGSVWPWSAGRVLDVEVPAGTQAAEIMLPFALPPREVKQIATLRGKLQALVPGRQVQFKFNDLANAAGKTQRNGGVQVTVDAVRKNNAVWEIHMRIPARRSQPRPRIAPRLGVSERLVSRRWRQTANGSSRPAWKRPVRRRMKSASPTCSICRKARHRRLDVDLRNAGGDCRAAGRV